MLNTRIENSEKAVELALEYTGFYVCKNLEIKSPDDISRQSVFSDSTLSFLNSKLIGKNVWIVSFDSLSVDRNDCTKGGQDNLKKYEILLDAESGKLIKIVGKNINDSITIYEPFSKPIENRIHEWGEKYHGFPDELPQVSLFESLKSVRSGDPNNTRVITAYYVVYSGGASQTEPTSAWIVILSGLPPVKVTPPYVSETDKPAYSLPWHEGWDVINAITGENMSSIEIGNRKIPKE